MHVDHPVINAISLCSGGGGLDVGVQLALPHVRVRAYVEREAFAIYRLEAQMREGLLDAAPIWTDLTTFDCEPWVGAVDLIVAGWPCPPYSVAGRRRGAADPRDLWPHVDRIVQAIRPRLFFGENVSGFASHPDGFERSRRDLKRLGYRTAATLVTAAEVGASHERERLFLLAVADTGHRGRRAGERDQEAGAGPATDRIGPDGGGGHLGDPVRGGRRGDARRGTGPESQDGHRPTPVADAGDRLVPLEGRGTEGRTGPGPTEPTLAEPQGGERGGDREPSGPAGQPERRGGLVGDTDEQRVDPRAEAGGSRPATGESSGLVDDTPGPGREEPQSTGRATIEAGSPARPNNGPERSGSIVADTQPAGLQGTGPEQSARRGEFESLRRDGGADPRGLADAERARLGGLGLEGDRLPGADGEGAPRDQPDGRHLPLHAPPPGARDEWRRILEIDWRLSPALSLRELWEQAAREVGPPSDSADRLTQRLYRKAVKRGVRRLADVLELSERPRRLRLLGNGVVPLQAAYALVTLIASWEVTDAADEAQV